MNKSNFFSPAPLFLVKEKFNTKFENKFFKLTSHCNLTLYFDTKEFSFDKMKIYRAFDGFKEEILENINLLNDSQKSSYLNRIMDRINNIEYSCISESAIEYGKLRLSVNGEEYSPVTNFSAYCKMLSRKKNDITDLIHSLLPVQPSDSNNNCLTKPQINPTFNPEYLHSLYKILKPFFADDQHHELKQLLKKGNNTIDPLIFLGCGNRLADVFKQFFNAGLISGCEKKDLENWISRNFKYSFHQKSSDFNLSYLNKIISSNNDTCRNPIINIYKNTTTGKFSIKLI